MPSKPIIPANRRFRWIAIVMVLLGLILGILLYRYFQSYLETLEVLAEDSPERALEKLAWLFRVVVGVIVIGAWGIGAYCAHVGLKTIRTGCFPPPGTWVIRDAQVYQGTAAKQTGILLIVSAVIIIIAGVGCAWYTYHLIDQLTEAPVKNARFAHLNTQQRASSTPVRSGNLQYVSVVHRPSFPSQQ